MFILVQQMVSPYGQLDAHWKQQAEHKGNSLSSLLLCPINWRSLAFHLWIWTLYLPIMANNHWYIHPSQIGLGPYSRPHKRKYIHVPRRLLHGGVPSHPSPWGPALPHGLEESLRHASSHWLLLYVTITSERKMKRLVNDISDINKLNLFFSPELIPASR